jgi:hypothetical protein
VVFLAIITMANLIMTCTSKAKFNIHLSTSRFSKKHQHSNQRLVHTRPTTDARNFLRTEWFVRFLLLFRSLYLVHGSRSSKRNTTSKRGRQKEKLTKFICQYAYTYRLYSKILHNPTPFGFPFLTCSHFQLFLNVLSTSDFRRNLPAHAGGKLGKERKGNGIGFSSHSQENGYS